MLIDCTPKSNNPTTDRILALLGCSTNLRGLVEGDSFGAKYVEHQPGIYDIGHFNGSHLFPEDEFDQYPSGINCGAYGVCDSVENLLTHAPELITSERQFVITLTSVRRDQQSPSGGWRWHKWGDYIGSHDIQCEYLYDEEGIDEVFCYHVFEKVKVIALADLKHGEYYRTAGLTSFFDGVRWDENKAKFKAYVFDHDARDMVIREYDYSNTWNRRLANNFFAPTSIWCEQPRRTVPLDGEQVTDDR
jgi:hypothetical protein